MGVRIGFFVLVVAVASTSAGADRANVDLAAPAQPAIEKGLAFLAARQGDDGAFSTNGYGRNVAVCALAGMAWLSVEARRIAGRMASRSVA